MVGLVILTMILLFIGVVMLIVGVIWYLSEVAGGLVSYPRATLKQYNFEGLHRLMMRLAVELFEVRVVHNAVDNSYAVEVRSLPVGWTTVDIGRYSRNTRCTMSEDAEATAEELIALAHLWIAQSKKDQRVIVKTLSVQHPKEQAPTE
jgi:hypothetical protein